MEKTQTYKDFLIQKLIFRLVTLGYLNPNREQGLFKSEAEDWSERCLQENIDLYEEEMQALVRITT